MDVMVMDNCNILLKYIYIKWIINSTSNMVTTTTIEKGENTTLKSINNYTMASKEKRYN